MEAYEVLENRLREWIGCKNVVACSSGTAALHLALEAMQIPSPEKKEVILCDYNMIACARAITLAGMKVVLIDCGRNLLIDTTKIEKVVGKNTIAIMATHVYGRLCEMDSIHRVAKKHDLIVIEDMAEAHGCTPHRDTHASCYSFYKNKVVRGEEGGCIGFNSTMMTAIARKLRNLGFNDYHDYTHMPRGHNYRMSNAHAELILTSLSRVNETIVERRIIEGWYEQEFGGSYQSSHWLMPLRRSPWVYDIRLRGISIAKHTEVIDALRYERVRARHGFKPISSQPEYRKMKVVGLRSDVSSETRLGEMSEASQASRTIVYFPIEPGMTHEEVQKTSDITKKVMAS